MAVTDCSLTSQLAVAMPLSMADVAMPKDRTGLIIVDEVNGFCTVGAGNLAPPVPNAQIAAMVDETVRLARDFAAQDAPIFAFLDTHEPGKPEPPYPPHCERGTGEEELVPELAWLHDCPQATLWRKDCINGFIGAIDNAAGRNALVDWAATHELTMLVVTGICTDICVMDFVLTSLSARNHGLLGKVEDIVVLEPACSTYSLDKAVAVDLGLPAEAAHPQAPTHYMGLYFMASRGAVLARSVTWAG